MSFVQEMPEQKVLLSCKQRPLVVRSEVIRVSNVFFQSGRDETDGQYGV